MRTASRAPVGSSPRGRGKLAVRTGSAWDARLIPARAGKTRGAAGLRMSQGAHPRAGGENCRLTLWPPARRGSSPRGRGKPSRSASGSNVVRLIPARAGKTLRSKMRSPWRPAHPRAGGENLKCGCLGVVVLGSSPRGRGKRPPPRRSHERTRLIPARAGKTLASGRGREAPEAHPRAGGENGFAYSRERGFEGSSPRGRGKHGRSP